MIESGVVLINFAVFSIEKLKHLFQNVVKHLYLVLTLLTRG